jgi:uncharacterized membrane protein YdjX (TVP38/TMEM64 family)
MAPQTFAPLEQQDCPVQRERKLAMPKETKNRSRTMQQVMNVAHITIIVVVLAATIIYYFRQYDSVNRQNIESFIRGFGAWAPVAYAALYIICAPIPFLAPLFSAVGGLLFGAIRGTIYILFIATASALVPFSLARRLGQEWVEGKVKGKKLDEIYQRSAGNKGFMFIVLLRLIPALPWEVQNYVAGLTKVSIPTFVLGTMLGIIPGSFSLAFLGASATDPTSWQFYAAVALKIVTALIPAIVTFVRSRRKKQQKAETEAVPQ